MAGWNGSGTFSRTYNWVQDQGNGILIRADRHDANDTDFVNGINNCITKDGQNTPSANMPMATYRHTGVGNGVARTDYAAMGQVQDAKVNWVVAGGTVDAITATYSPAITSLVDGQECCVRTSGTNTISTPTFSPNGLTARTIVKEGGGALADGDIPHEMKLRYNLANTRWELQNPETKRSLIIPRTTGTLTIASGVITVTGSHHLIDTEGGAATDDLDTINGGVDGMIVVLRDASSSRDVTLKDGTGNLRLAGDCTLANVGQMIMLMYCENEAFWQEISRSNN
jgi:hypothetical protein